MRFLNRIIKTHFNGEYYDKTFISINNTPKLITQG